MGKAPEETLKYFENAVEEESKARDYSQQRIDYVTILIATLGIFQITQITNEIRSTYCDCALIFMIPLVLFSAAIVFNIISQLLSLIVHTKAARLFKDTAFQVTYFYDDYKPEKLTEDQAPLKKYNSPIFGFQIASIIAVCTAIIISFISYYLLM